MKTYVFFPALAGIKDLFLLVMQISIFFPLYLSLWNKTLSIFHEDEYIIIQKIVKNADRWSKMKKECED